MLTLHGYFRSSTTYRIRLGLAIKGLEYSAMPVNLVTGEHSGETYKALNAFGTVPTLVDGDERLVQSMAILAELDERYPDKPLLPVSQPFRRICRELCYAIATEIHAPNNLAALKYIKAEFNADETAVKAWYAHWIHRTFEPVEQRLAAFDARQSPYPFGAAGLFETVLIPQIYNARRFGIVMDRYPILSAIDAEVKGDPRFDAAHPDAQPDAP